ncbi:Sjoegren syndrome nuclear autoantigen 1 homolog [Anopheles darlingi]|uniref:Sjoegren syndrome nuclear autoantigen 1 homolog n=1 Tax=Anopheles darlingi TaxID=43151 RepID=UPI002100035A|nr:Sjoegren syndrome nuclear autoantigen 1 homolog [Anopheles darlingi]
MSETAARLQSQNEEMVKSLETLREQRRKLEERITSQERQRQKIRKDIEDLQRTLAELDGSIAGDERRLGECTKCLTETENGYSKVVETLELLLLSAKEKSSSIKKE